MAEQSGAKLAPNGMTEAEDAAFRRQRRRRSIAFGATRKARDARDRCRALVEDGPRVVAVEGVGAVVHDLRAFQSAIAAPNRNMAIAACAYGRRAAMGQAAFWGSAARSTPCFLASFSIASMRQLGIFEPFQLDTVVGASFSARATATVPPSASIMSAALSMPYCYDIRNDGASG